ncbi:MAG: M48 family metallopeptidase [Deltaproteobacteria bacterium]|nr:M48 family metallopeptidase [Deltaproteobacteria bacterium]
MEHARFLFLFIYIAIAAFGYALEYLNIRHLRRRHSPLPQELEREIDPDLLSRAEAYTIGKTKFGIVSSLCNNSVFLVFFFGGGLEWYDRWIKSLGHEFMLSGVLFFILLSFAVSVLNIPFKLYHAFVIEKRYGFNTMTPLVWAADLVKGAAVSTALMVVAVSAALWLYAESPEFWWVWLWFFYLGLSIFLMYVSPYVIEPLFNKFEPVGDPALEESIRGLMGKAGIKVSRVFKMDASRRTAHTNAYFTGIGRVKRIVLYDTLLEKLTGKEIAAVLAHETGHWKKRHLLKGIMLSEAVALISLYLAHILLKGGFLNELFGISGGSFFTGVFILGFLGSIASFPFEPIFSYISRRHEREADRFSYGLTGDSRAMIGSLVKLSKDNLSNLHPHPLYVAIHYSHPPVAERIRDLRKLEGG